MTRSRSWLYQPGHHLDLLQGIDSAEIIDTVHAAARPLATRRAMHERWLPAGLQRRGASLGTVASRDPAHPRRLRGVPRGQRWSVGDGEPLLGPRGDRLQCAYGRRDVVDVELAQ